METRFGVDFSSVRVHTDPAAGALDALAYTVGENVFFAPGQFNPSSGSGGLLLAHELSHVIQQRGVGGEHLGLSRAPVGLYRGMAGGCFVPGMFSTAIGTRVHDDLQRDMYSLYPFIQAEVPIPGSSRSGGTGFVDFYHSALLPFIQPVGSTHRMPGRAGLPFPPLPAPEWAGLGSIKPITFGHAAGLLDLARYVTAFNAYYTLSGGTGVGGTILPFPTPPTWMTPGRLFPLSPPWLLQELHIFTTFDGMYWYFCRPSALQIGLAIWLARYIAEKLQQFMDSMRRVLEPILIPIGHAISRVLEAIAEAAQAIIDFIAEYWLEILLVILLVVAVILVIVFWEVIVAAIAAAFVALGGALAAAGAVLVKGLTALTALLGPEGAAAAAAAIIAVIGLLPAEARAATPQDFQEPAASDMPAIPGGLTPLRVPPGLSPGNFSIEDATNLLRRAASLGPGALPQLFALSDEAQRMAAAFPHGAGVIRVFELLKGLFQMFGGVAPPAAGGGAAPSPGGGGAVSPEAAGGAAVPPGGGAAPPRPETSPPPPSRGAAPPQAGPPGTGSPPASSGGGARSVGTGRGPGGWPILFEEIGSAGHFQILPSPDVDPGGTYAITQGRNAAAVLVVEHRGGAIIARNPTTGEEAEVAASSLLPGGWKLVSGAMATRLQEELSQWRRLHRRPRLEDLVYPELHFR
jgi:hypothetical protein